MRVLHITVGGSGDPVVKSIKSNKPDFVYFYCTDTGKKANSSKEVIDGEGYQVENRVTNTKEKKENVVKQTGLQANQYEIVIVNPDDPFECFEKALANIEKELSKGNRVIADYTGGTKSMSVGLGTAALENPECQICIVTGQRLDTVKVRSGMERVSKLPMNKVYMERQLKEWESFFKVRDYQSALQVLENLSVQGYGHEDNFDRYYTLTKAFNEWDKFNYVQAELLIEPYQGDKDIIPYNINLKKIVRTLTKYLKEWTPEGNKKQPGPGFPLVYDVLNNALRRANQGRYDDAVARIYRSIEMYAQFCLMTNKPGFKSGEVEINRLPESIRQEFAKAQSDTIALGLMDTYKLLASLDHPIKEVWETWKGRIFDKIQTRNKSFLAHGYDPVTESEFKEFKEVVWGFIQACDEALGFKEGLKDYQQLPNKLETHITE